VRQVVDVHEFETQLFCHAPDRSVSEGSPGVPDGANRVFSELFDRGQVVVKGAHVLSKLGVGAASLFWRRDRFLGSAREFAVHPDHRGERLICDGA